MRAIKIDARLRKLVEIELPEADEPQLAMLQQEVGGYIEVAARLPCGDVVFVDEEGRLKGPPPGWFALSGTSGALAGNGVVVGHEDDEGGITPAMISVDELEMLVVWLA